MANGIEADIREVRASVHRIDREGCGQRVAQEDSIKALWESVEAIKKGQGDLLRNVVLSVLAVVITAMIGNFFLTRQTMADMVKTSVSTSAEVAAKISAQNQEILKAMSEEIRHIKSIEDEQSKILKNHRSKSTYDKEK